MGNQTSTNAANSSASGFAPDDVLQAAKTGGCCAIGGYTEMQQYGESIYSKAKEKLIRDIADDTFGALGLSGKKPKKTESIDKVVAELMRLAPGGKGRAKFTADFYKNSKAQRDLCHAMAKAINRNYGSMIIPTNATEAEVCAKVAEVMNTLLTGMHTEFLSVSGDVSRIIRNIETLKRFTDASYKRQEELAKSCGDTQISIQADNATEFYKRIQLELDRQLAILTNLMSVTIDPASQNLIKALEDNRDFYGTVRELREDLGTPAFGNKLALLLSGVSTVAHSADLVDKALRRIGMSVQEFKSAKNPAEMRMKVLKHIQDKNPGSKELDQMIQAANLIFRNDYSHAAVAKLVGTNTRGGRAANVAGVDDVEDVEDVSDSEAEERGVDDMLGGDGYGMSEGVNTFENNSNKINSGPSDIDMQGNQDGLDEDMQGNPGGVEHLGGDDDKSNGLYWDRKNLSKKIDRKDKYRDMILKDFKKIIQGQYRNIVDAADHIAKNIGSSIPVNEDLERFVQVFSQVDTLDRENLHVALSGYPRDAESRYLRDQFLDKYRLLIDVIKPLTNGPAGPQFKEIQKQCETLIKTIDDFADKMVKSLTEIHIDRPDQIRAELKRSSNLFFGNAEPAEMSGGDSISFGDGSFVALKKVQNELRYYLSIAHIKTNLARVSEEMKDYADDYDDMVGEEAAYMIDSIKREFQALISEVEDKSSEAIESNPSIGIDANVAKGGDGAASVQINLLPAAEQAGARAALIAFYTYQMNAKVKMVEVAQSIDIYMRYFADGIARDPDSIKSVVKMLDQVEIVAKWFTEKSGDNLANLFEYFPAGVNRTVAAPVLVNGAAPTLTKTGTGDFIKGNKHYYESVTVQSLAGNLGNPFIGRVLESKDQAEGLQKQTEKCIKSMRALENILSTFFSVGDKFAGEELKSKSILTPGYILNALFEYINASAYASKYNPAGVSANNPYITGLDHETAAAGAAPDSGANNGAFTNPPTIKVAVNNTGITDALARNPVNLAATRPDELGVSTDIIASNRNSFGIFEHGAMSDPLANYLISGVANINKNKISIAMSSIPYDAVPLGQKDNAWWHYHNPEERKRPRLNRAAWLDTFYDTDMLFVMVIKSIITKILAVVDAYRLFNKPVDTTARLTSYKVVNPLRGILGGAGHDEVDGGAKARVMPEALELYVRLPLLAEWYREQLSLEEQKTGNATTLDEETWRLVVVPSIDGIWSGFMSILFDKANYVKQGNYTESQLDSMIDEMNSIYKHYKSRYPRATVRNIIVGFISEINHAFGFMSRDQIKKYLDNRRKYLQDPRNYPTSGDSEDDFNNYDLLDSEDQYGRAPVPSDKYLTVALKQQKQRKRNMVYLQEVVNKLRAKIDKSLIDGVNKLSMAGGGTFTFNETLTNYRKELDAARDENERHRMVIRLLQGSDRLNVGNVDKFIMVHEAVAAPLTQLFSVYKVLADINSLFHGASIKNIDEFLVKQDGTVKTVALLQTDYDQHLLDTYFTNAPNKDLAENYKQFQLRGKMYLSTGLAGDPNDLVDKNRRIFTLLAPNRLLRDIISLLSDLASNPNKLIQVNISSPGNVNIDWSILESLAMELLAQVKSNINSLRLDLSYGTTATGAANVVRGQVTLLKDYEDREICGSVPWLEERLVESLFRDRDQSGLGSGLNQFIQTVKCLTNNDSAFNGRIAGGVVFDYNADFTIKDFIYSIVVATGVIATDAGQAPMRNNLRTFPFNVLSIKVDNDLLSTDQKTALQKLVSNQALAQAEVTAANGIIPVPFINYGANAALVTNGTQISASNLWNMTNVTQKNLLCFFNKLVHMYLATSFDESSMKIYTPLIENFMSSAASKEVNSVDAANVIDNTRQFAVPLAAPAGAADAAVRAAAARAASAAGRQPNNNAPIANHAILYKSTVETMKSLMQNMDMRMKKKKHIFESLAEVPVYMKERMKCNLPLFSKMFNIVFERADLLRKLLNNAGFVNACDGADKNATKKNYDTHLSRFCDLALSIKKCCDSVHKELQDAAPYFMDLGKDFISDYKQRYGAAPFMPASDVVLPQRGYSEINPANFASNSYNYLLLPTRENGSDVYRYNYASRLLLVRPDIEPSLDHMPGAKEIFNNYAEIAAKAKHISAQEYAGTIKNLVRVARFLNDGVVYSRFLDGAYGAIAAPDHFDSNVYSSNSPYNKIYNTNELTVALASRLAAFNASMQLPAAAAAAAPVAAPVFDATKFITKKCVQFERTNDLRRVLQFTENSVKETAKNEYAVIISNSNRATPYNRNDLQILNIIDLDVVPINVHALMREVPFVNILNYSYTFDRMVQELIVPGYMLPAVNPPAGNPPAFIGALDNVKSTKELMVKMLIHPYTPFTIGNAVLDPSKRIQYLGVLASLFNGNDDFRLGRPRYLSDQIWGKVLLNSPVEFSDEQMLPLEMGPPGYLASHMVGRSTNSVIGYPGVDVFPREAIPGSNGAPLRPNPPVLGVRGIVLPSKNSLSIDLGQLMPKSAGLRYWHNPQKNWVVANITGVRVNNPAIGPATPVTVLNPAQVRYCAQLGALRFDTKLVRNLVWLTQAQRLIRVALITHLSRLETPVVRGLKIADPKITEYNANDAWTADDYNAVNNEFL